MNDGTYTIKIKNEFASAILADLEHKNAIEVLGDDVYGWQQSTLKVEDAICNNRSALFEYEFFRLLDNGDE